MSPVTITTEPLGIPELIAVIAGDQVVLGQDALSRIASSREVVERALSTGKPVYGLNTGIGQMKDTAVPREQLRGFQETLLATHSSGVGASLPAEVVRGSMMARLNGIARGGSAAGPEAARSLAEMLNRGVHPVVSSVASVGAGDLSQMASIALVAVGGGKAEYKGEILSGSEALRRAGISPLVLEPGEALALMSANSISIASAVMALHRAKQMAELADLAVALSLEATVGNPSGIHPSVATAKPFPGQIQASDHLGSILEESYLLEPGTSRSIQDPLSFRVAPQVHGAFRDFISQATSAVEIELNSRSDNPLISIEEGTMIHNGNFDPIVMALDFDALRTAIAHVGQISERRMSHLWEQFFQRLNDATLKGPGDTLAEFFGISLRYPGAAIFADLKQLASPASLDSPPLSGELEDHGTNAPLTVSKTDRALMLLEDILLIEMLMARDVLAAAGSRPQLGRGTGRLLDSLESAISATPHPRSPADVHRALSEAGLGREASRRL
jgi:histidine ammonia-lyase